MMIESRSFSFLSTINNELSTFRSRLGQKFLADMKLGISRKKNIGGKDFTRRQIASGNVFFIFNMLTRIDQDGPGFFLYRVVLGPFREHSVGGVDQLNLNSLIRWKIERDHMTAHVGNSQFHFYLSNLGEPHRLGGNLKIDNQSAQFAIVVFWEHFG